MPDISLAVGDDARRMTYAELAAVRGISVPSARRLVLRHRWPRQAGNDGIVRVTVPLAALEKPEEAAGSHVTVTDATAPMTAPTTAQASDVTDPLISDQLKPMRGRVGGMRPGRTDRRPVYRIRAKSDLCQHAECFQAPGPVRLLTTPFRSARPYADLVALLDERQALTIQGKINYVINSSKMC